jgi:TPR repeat protein
MISDASTIKARMARSKQSHEITPEMHLSKGVECHEVGSLQESTYHFRLAAKAGLSDAMLLYALACRHGWGMRPNPAEAVSWLQKAVDSAQLEVAEDEATASQGKALDAIDRAKHRAQFALGVYELGMSYMKGWGVQQDKPLALRCFEVAGSWGDADALSEAGFCYTEGIGCKKDMKKAAKFYRMAEAKGMSMAGNSWYVCISLTFQP